MSRAGTISSSFQTPVKVPLLFALAAALLMLRSETARAQAGPAVAPRVRQFEPGSVSRVDDLPAGRFRDQMNRLEPAARSRALDRLHNFHFTELDLDSLHVDQDGGVLYVDTFSLDTTAVSGTSSETATATVAVPVSPFPAGLAYHSRPGAPNVLYLNFSGKNVTGTAWNSSVGRTTIPAVAFDTDGDPTTFGDGEQVAIKCIWERVSEDYAPFNIDVTTEPPATFTTRTAEALITRNTDANGAANPSSDAGGVAYVGVFGGSSYASSRPAWIYYNNLASTESYIGEAASHEIGHNLGLSHDGTTTSGYYSGHGSDDISWGPIMGTGYNRNVSQWSKGEYYQANNTQDDLATISSMLSYRVDDHGNAPATATPLVMTGTNLFSTTPESDPQNLNSANKGVLEANNDVDVFSFTTGNGAVDLIVNPWIMPSGTHGGNLDVSLELRDQAGSLLATNNPPLQTTAEIQITLSEGLYYLYVRNSGAGDPMNSTPTGYTAYGSIGQYFISGYLVPSSFVIPPAAQLQITDITQSETASRLFTVTYSGSTEIDVSTIDNQDVRLTGPNGYDRLARFVSLNATGNGSPRIATYAADPPDGTAWQKSDNGAYSVWMQTNQVADTAGSFVAPSQLGQFNVDIMTVVYAANMDTNPGWSLQPLWQYGPPAYLTGTGPTSGATGGNILGYNLSGNYEDRLTAKYATTPLINCSGSASLSLRFSRWLRVKGSDSAFIQISTNGIAWVDFWTAQGVSDTSWQKLQYALPAWTFGSATLQLRWGLSSGQSQNDIGWNLDDVEILASGVASPVSVQLAVTVNYAAWGSVNPAAATLTLGDSIQITATPAPYYRFIGWSGNASGTNNPLSLVLNSDASIQANFGEITTTNTSTPYWWLAAYGCTNNFETAVASIGANGMPLWESYIAGLNPDDPESQLKLSVSPNSDGTGCVLNWNTVTGRVYSIWSSTNLLSDFAPVAVNLSAATQSLTNAVTPVADSIFYRLQVEKP